MTALRITVHADKRSKNASGGTKRKVNSYLIVDGEHVNRPVLL